MTSITANPMMAGGQPEGPGMLDQLAKAHGMAKAMFDKTSAGLAHLQTMNAALGKLASLGDTITEDDVIKAAGNLVSTGTHSAHEMAVILSDMPAQGGLAPWIAEHLAQNVAVTKQVAQAHALAQHETAASGIRLVSALTGQDQGAMAGPLAASGPATPQGVA